MLTFLSASSNNNFSTNLTALNRNSTAATSTTASCSRQELDYFITSVNSFHPALKYTWVVSECSIVFLDINVSSVATDSLLACITNPQTHTAIYCTSAELTAS